MIRNRPQPKRNPIDGPYASLRNTYWPPARGHIAANSAQHSAPVIVSTPASAQAISSHPGEPTNRDDSADVIKIPEPIIDPTTIMVASSRLKPRTSLGEASLLIQRARIVPQMNTNQHGFLTLLNCSPSLLGLELRQL